MSLHFIFLFFGVAQSFALLSNNLQSIVNTKLMPSDLVKMKAVDPNWRGDGIFERITKEAGLFVHKETNEILLETKHKMWKEIEIIETYRPEGFLYFRPDKIKNLIRKKDWKELFLRSLGADQVGNNWKNALTEIIDVNGYEGGQPVLMKAVIFGDTSVVKMLLEKGSKVNAQNWYERTALHYAAMLNNIEAIDLILKFNPEINATDRSKETPLMKAVEESDFDAVKLLLRNGARLDLQNIVGKTALNIAKHKRDQYMFDKENKKIIELLETQREQPLLEFNAEINTTDKIANSNYEKETHSSIDSHSFMKNNENKITLDISNYTGECNETENEEKIGSSETEQNQAVLEKKNKKSGCQNCVII